jgi:hypothetical protein
MFGSAGERRFELASVPCGDSLEGGEVNVEGEELGEGMVTTEPEPRLPMLIPTPTAGLVGGTTTEPTPPRGK